MQHQPSHYGMNHIILYWQLSHAVFGGDQHCSCSSFSPIHPQQLVAPEIDQKLKTESKWAFLQAAFYHLFLSAEMTLIIFPTKHGVLFLKDGTFNQRGGTSQWNELLDWKAAGCWLSKHLTSSSVMDSLQPGLCCCRCISKHFKPMPSTQFSDKKLRQGSCSK